MSKNSKSDGEKKMKAKKYQKELRKLQGELCKLQEWVKHKGLRVIIVFEGRDAAGKGGTIKAITERVSPRVFRLVALPAPSDREKSQMYIQRYMQHFPAAGEVVIFDRSWYNRLGVEYVMGFCTKEQHRRFLELCPEMEKYIVEGGIKLIKVWLEVSDKEQKRRFEARMEDPLRQWKLSPMDLPSRSKWFEYSRARDMMLKATDTKWAPWYILRFGRQEARAPQLHPPHPEPDSVQESAAREGQAAQALDEGRLRRPGVAQRKKTRAGEILTDTAKEAAYCEPSLDYSRPVRDSPRTRRFAAALTPGNRGRGRQRRKQTTNRQRITSTSRIMKKQILYMIGLATLLASATQASQEQLAKSIQDAKLETSRTSEQLKSTLSALNALTKQTKGDLRPAYNTYCAEVDQDGCGRCLDTHAGPIDGHRWPEVFPGLAKYDQWHRQRILAEEGAEAHGRRQDEL